MVHDSVLESVPENGVDKAIPEIREIMEIELKGMKLTVSIQTLNACPQGETCIYPA